jgi:hypothetical protein
MEGLAPAGSLLPEVSLRATMGSPRAAYLLISVPVNGRVGSSWKSFPRSVFKSHHGITKGCLPLERCSNGCRGRLQLEVFSQKCL